MPANTSTYVTQFLRATRTSVSIRHVVQLPLNGSAGHEIADGGDIRQPSVLPRLSSLLTTWRSAWLLTSNETLAEDPG